MKIEERCNLRLSGGAFWGLRAYCKKQISFFGFLPGERHRKSKIQINLPFFISFYRETVYFIEKNKQLGAGGGGRKKIPGRKKTPPIQKIDYLFNKRESVALAPVGQADD